MVCSDFGKAKDKIERLSENMTMLKYVRANSKSKNYIYKSIIIKFNSEMLATI
jgi:hypothetical protein